MLYLDAFSENDFRRLDAVRDDICVSIYMPTHLMARHGEEQDRVGFRDLVRDLQKRLEEAGADKRRVGAMIEHMEDLVEDESFWRYLAKGLAVLATPETVQTYRLPMEVPQTVDVSDRFHLKPMIPLLAFQRRAYVLDLTIHRAILWEVSEGDIREVDVPGLPKTFEEAMVARVGIDWKIYVGKNQSAHKKTYERLYCRQVEGAMRNFLRGQKTPLVLAGVETVLSYYKEVDTYGHTHPEMITGNQEHTPHEELAERVRAIVEKGFHAVIERHIDDVNNRQSANRGSTDISEIARAAQEGRVERLLVNLDEPVYGTLEAGVGSFVPGTPDSPKTYDVLDELAGLTLRNGGEILCAHRDHLPEGVKAAATFRYAA
jgi:hypothetical protein